MKKYILLLFILLVLSLNLLPSFKAQAAIGDYLFKWGAEFYVEFPVYTAVDGSGNVYVSDHTHHRIQVYTSTGTLITEWGTFGSGDSQFNRPYGVAVDGSGNVYVVDSYNHRIQVFASDGTFIRKWGSLWYPGYDDDGDGHGRFYCPYGVAVDGSGNVYVSDYANHRIQVFTSDGTFIRTWGSNGSGDGQFNNPFGIAVDKISGDVYIADGYNHRIQVFASDGTFIRTWGSFWHPGLGGDGHGRFLWPYGVAVDGSGKVYVADTYNHRIQVFAPDGTFIRTWGSLGSGDGQFIRPYGVTVDGSGKVYVADRSNHRIQVFASDGTFINKWENHGNGNGQINNPVGIAGDKISGDIFITDVLNHRIQAFASDGTFIRTWGSLGTAYGQFKNPRGIAVDGSGNVYVADTYNHRIQAFASDGTFIRTWGSLGDSNGQFSNPREVTVDGSGNLCVADTSNHRIQVFASDGTFLRTWGSYGSGDGQFLFPCGVAIDTVSGDIYVTDAFNYRIQVFASDGTFLRKWGSYGSGDGQFNFPFRIAVDGSGNVYVSDNYNDRIQVFTSDGTFLGKWGSTGSSNGQFRYPSGITVDESGKVYVTDVLNHRVQIFEGAEDKIPPVAKCKNICVQLDITGYSDITAADIDDGSTDNRGISSMTIAPCCFTCANIGTNTVTLTVTDNSGNASTCTATVTVDDNIGPILDDNINAPSDPVPLNTAVDVSVIFTEACPDIASWDFGDNATSPGVIDEVNGLITGSHTYNTPGVYTLRVTLTDDGGNSDESIFQYIVVYDPYSSFVTGSGWIDSPAGAYIPDPSLTGKANFGFVSKYKRGANTPIGETQFHFKVADLKFHSDSYDWLVVAGPNAKYKGTGKINGEGEYGFMLTAIDGDKPGGGGVDRFRIKIWDATEKVIYDNKMGEADDSYEATELSGGSIVIHN